METETYAETVGSPVGIADLIQEPGRVGLGVLCDAEDVLDINVDEHVPRPTKSVKINEK